MKARTTSKSKEPVTVKKPAAKAKPVPKPPVHKTAAGKKATPVAKNKAAVTKTPVRKAAAPAPAAKKAPVKRPPAAHPTTNTKAASRPVALTPAPTPMKKSAAVASAGTKPAAASAAPAVVPAPARVPRVSRLSQLTVPSMPQAVASTAAKASFTPTMSSSTAFVPPPPVAVKKDPKLANNWKTKTSEQLSDAEVIAMPDAEYMNDKQMAFFRLKLIQLKQGILENAGETTEHLREDTVVVPDPADRATIEEEHALELRTRDRERKLLKKIEQSIARIDAGDYGYCDETGEPIGVGRLLARPTATLSLEAQQRRELKQKMFGD
jgi:DnaK suppressor protein